MLAPICGIPQRFEDMKTLFVLYAVIASAIVCVNAAAHAPLRMSVISWNLAEKTPSKADAAVLAEHASSDVVIVGVQVGLTPASYAAHFRVFAVLQKEIANNAEEHVECVAGM